jgi:hypothetical protein
MRVLVGSTVHSHVTFVLHDNICPVSTARLVYFQIILMHSTSRFCFTNDLFDSLHLDVFTAFACLLNCLAYEGRVIKPLV